VSGFGKLIVGAIAVSLSALLIGGTSGASQAEAKGAVRRVEFRREVVNLEDLIARLVQNPPPSVRRGPAIHGDLWYGEIFRQLPDDEATSREHTVPFAVLFEGPTMVRAWCDVNLNGDLTDDPEVKLSLFPGDKPARSFLAELRWSARQGGKEVPIERLVRVVVENADAPDSVHRYRTQEVYGMLGTVGVDGAPRLALLYDANHDGIYTRGNSDGVFFDLDGDRHFSIDVMAPEFGPFAIPFPLGRKTYVVDEVDPGGSSISMHLLGPAAQTPPPVLGQLVPNFEYVDLAGHPVRLSDYRGKPVVVYFWSSWCSGCRRQAADLRALYQRYRPLEVEILGISYDTNRHEMERFRKEGGQSWPTSFTGGFPTQDPVGRLFRETGSSVFYVVAPDGRLAAKVFEVTELDEQLAKLLAHQTERAGVRLLRCSPPTCKRPVTASILPSSGRCVASATAGIATRPGRPLPGQDSHLLDQRAFHGARYSQNGPQGLIGRTKPGRVPCTGSR